MKLIYKIIAKTVLAILLGMALGCCFNPPASGLEVLGASSYKEFLYQGTISIKYREHNPGHPCTLLFIHGFGAASHYWRALEDYFASSYNTIALDLKGFGYSAKPRDGKYRLTDQAELLTAFIQEKNLRNIILVGHSMGGAVALLTTFRVKEPLIKGLILLDNASYAQEPPEFIRLLRTPVLNRLGPALLPDRFLVRRLLQQVFWDKEKITDEMIRTYCTYLQLPGAHYALRQTAYQIVPDNVDEIIDQTVRLKLPVLIIWGENDQILALSSGQRLHYDIKKSEFVIIPESGHNPHEEKPAETIRAMASFLSRRIPACL
ncbi:MAG: alpha/beta hydrolase [Deltaproteobacteria bacterium]|nr:alpha/beta hydrolase [Deltaproteobacteria bacterium]